MNAGGDHDRQRAEHDQQLARELPSERVLDRRNEAHDAIERGVQQEAGEHRGNRRRCLAVRVREPGMDRRQARLGAVAHEDEDEGELHQGRIEMRLGGGELRPEQRVSRRGAVRLDRRRGQQRSHEGEGDADRADDQVLPHRLERQPARVQRDQEGGQQRRRFHADPHDAEIVRNQDQQHRRLGAEPQRAEAAGDGGGEDVRGLMPEIDAGKGRAQHEHQRQHDYVESGKGVDIEPLAGCRHEAFAADDRGPDIAGEQHLRRRSADDRRQHVARPRAAGGRAGCQGSTRRAPQRSIRPAYTSAIPSAPSADRRRSSRTRG